MSYENKNFVVVMEEEAVGVVLKDSGIHMNFTKSVNGLPLITVNGRNMSLNVTEVNDLQTWWLQPTKTETPGA